MRVLIYIVLDVQVSLEFSLEVSCGGQTSKLSIGDTLPKRSASHFERHFLWNLAITGIFLPLVVCKQDDAPFFPPANPGTTTVGREKGPLQHLHKHRQVPQEGAALSTLGITGHPGRTDAFKPL